MTSLILQQKLSYRTKDDLCNQSKIGVELFNDFVNDRIKSGKLRVWSPTKKRSWVRGAKFERRWRLRQMERCMSLKRTDPFLCVCCWLASQDPRLIWRMPMVLTSFLLYTDRYSLPTVRCSTVPKRVCWCLFWKTYHVISQLTLQVFKAAATTGAAVKLQLEWELTLSTVWQKFNQWRRRWS